MIGRAVLCKGNELLYNKINGVQHYSMPQLSNICCNTHTHTHKIIETI